MKKAYWLAPVIVLIAFVGLYMQSRKKIEANAEEQKRIVAEDKRKKVEEAKRQQEQVAEKRRLDTEAKKKKEAEELALKAAEDKHREDIEYARDFAQRETTRYQMVVKELSDALKGEAEAKKKATDEIDSMRKEKEFLTTYVAQAQGNEKVLRDLMLRLEELEKERAKVAAALVAAKKNS